MNYKKIFDKLKYMSFHSLVRSIKYMFSKRSLKFFWQRCTRGWSDSDTWSMDGTFACFILPRLIRFKELHNGHPHDLTAEEWENIIQSMIDAFTFYAGEDRFDSNAEDFVKAQVGLDLFAKWYGHLWW